MIKPLILLASVFATSLNAAEIYLAPDRFVVEVLGNESLSRPELLWLTRERAVRAADILGHAPVQLRQRYWRADDKTVWLLDEIGKEEPISAGFVVENGKIIEARVLVYRESRGSEIRHPGFLRQYEGVRLTADGRLDRDIDGISGATLSVRAMERMARLALFFDQLTRQ